MRCGILLDARTSNGLWSTGTEGSYTRTGIVVRVGLVVVAMISLGWLPQVAAVEEVSTAAVAAADFMEAAVGFTAAEDSPAVGTLDLVAAARLAVRVAASMGDAVSTEAGADEVGGAAVGA